MEATTEKTVRELALEIPGATRVFEKLGIDYCCGGNKSLEEACQSAGRPIPEVLDALQSAAAPAASDQRPWQAEALAELIAHIQSTHHRFTRDELARLEPLLNKVCS